MDDQTENLTAFLRRILPSSPGVALMHSSFAKLMPPESFDKADILAALAMLVDEGWTVAFPSFTFSFCHGKRFDLHSSPSETGILADWVLQSFPGAVRSPHPIYSFVAIGRRAKDIAACPATTSFGDDTPFAFFEKENAWQIALGNGVKDFTQCHRYEELAKVPYRYWKEFAGMADFSNGSGSRMDARRIFVLDLRIGAERDWNIIFDKARAEGCLTEHPLWRGKVHVIQTKDIKRIVSGILAGDCLGLLENAPEVRRRLQQTASGSPRTKIALLGHMNTQLLHNALERHLVEAEPRFVFCLHSTPYNQLEREMMLADSALRRLEPEISIFCDRLEDLFGGNVPLLLDRESIIARVEEYAGAIADWGARNGGWLIVPRFSPLDSAGELLGSIFFDKLNAIMANFLSGLDKVIWVDAGALAAEIEGKALDSRLMLMGRFPFSRLMTNRLAEQWTSLILSCTGHGVRVMVLDLDDTLWGGVLGDDGIHGLHLGSDYPGNAFQSFQTVLKYFAATGIMLTVASKNNQNAALDAMNSLPGMLIRGSDLVAHRIGWAPKWQGIREMADELNLGLGSFLFIDNDPVEREAVRVHLPEVKVADLSKDPADWAQTILASPWLAHIPATEADALRQSSYMARAAANSERNKALTQEEFYASLNPRLTIAPLSRVNLARAEQLCQKTNQFNTTGKRYKSRDLSQLASSGMEIFLLGAADKYAEHGDIGLIIHNKTAMNSTKSIIDTYLLSCRILGRGIECPALYWIMQRAARQGKSELEIEFNETSRNAPVTSALMEAGFRRTAPDRWSVSLATLPELPAWLTVDDRTAAADQPPGGEIMPMPLPVAPGGKQAQARLVSGGMVEDRVKQTVLSTLQRLFEPEVITEDAALGITPGWDSLRHFSVILSLEEEFGVAFSSAEIAETTSCRSLLRLCARMLQPSPSERII